MTDLNFKAIHEAYLQRKAGKNSKAKRPTAKDWKPDQVLESNKIVYGKMRFKG